MPPVFREVPPKELVLQLLKTAGLQSLNDSGWFSKTQIQLQSFEELIPQLEPYYLPCKAKVYLHTSLTPSTAVTILRQLLKPYGATLNAVEKTRLSVKCTWYQIQFDTKSSVTNMSEDGVTIDFT